MRFNNHYQVLKSLSSTASGRTFLAQTNYVSPPLICVVQQSGIQNIQDFHIFAQALKKIGLYSQIPELLDTFEEDGYFYLVQEFILGKNLDQERLFDENQIIQFLKNSLSIIKCLHEQQIIHGDIKPSNFIYKNSELILVDFRSAHLLNHPTTLLGDPQYTAPEQLQGKATFASDLYSIGMICLQLLTGMLPFDLLDDSFPEISNAALSQILERLVEPDVEKRFKSVKEVLKMMQRSGLIRLPSPQIKTSLWNCYATLDGDSGLYASINTVAISPNNQIIATGSDDRTVRLWDFQTTEEIGCLEGNRGFVKSIAFSPDGQQLASGHGDGTIQIWDIKTQTLVDTFIEHEQAVNTLIYRPTGQLISGSADKTVKLWNTPTITLKGHGLGITSIAIHPQLPMLASASSDRTVKLWHLDPLKQIHTLRGHTWAVRTLAISPDGTLLATGGDDNLIILWDLATFKSIKTISGHSWTVMSLNFSQDGQTLISGSWDKTIKLWEVATGKLIAVLEGHTDSVSGVKIHPTLSVIVSVSKDRTVKLWRDSNRSQEFRSSGVTEEEGERG